MKVTVLTIAGMVAVGSVAAFAMSLLGGTLDPVDRDLPAVSISETPAPLDSLADSSDNSSAERAAYMDAVASFDRPMPENYAFPAGLEGADTAQKWWWCANLHAAWYSYYREDDEPRAIEYLTRIQDVDPGSFGKYDDWVLEDSTVSIVSRDVSFIDGGVDGYYLEENSKGCYRWARDAGAEMWPAGAPD